MNLLSVSSVADRYAQPNLAGLLALYEQNHAVLACLLGTIEPYPWGAVARSSPALPALYLSVLQRDRFTTTYHLTHYFGETGAPQAIPDLQLRVYHDARQCEAIPDPVPEARRGKPLIPLSERWAINVLLNKWLRYCVDRGYRFGVAFPPVPFQPITVPTPGQE